MRCERCGRETNVIIMSFLNTEILCADCQCKEKTHPLYAEAKKAELEEVKKGNYDYPGLLANQKIQL